MTPTWQSAALALVSDLRNVFGDRLRSVVAFGPQLDGHTDVPLTCLALVSTLTMGDLEGCARTETRWRRAGVATPLILPEAEFRSSLDAFPLEYGEIVRAHQRVFGDDPFDGIAIAREDLRRACETQIKSHLVHLREGFIEAGGRPTAISDLVRASAPALTALLRHVSWLSGSHEAGRLSATRQGAGVAGLPENIIADVIALEQSATGQPPGPAELLPEYLTAVEQLARAVDAWRY